MRSIRINGRGVGPEYNTLVIAEIGVNHDGQVERALELVRAAADAGADAVKLQVFRAEALMHGSSSFASYQRQRCIEADPAAMLRRYELTRDELAAVVACARERNLIPLATPFSPADVPVLEGLGLPAVKIASPDVVNRPLLQRAAATGRPLLVSTGAATADEVAMAVDWLQGWGTPFVLLHCVSSYPTPDDGAYLSWVGELGYRFDVPVGYSDHTTNLLSGALAVAAGACVVEKHLTYDRSAQGPDHAASADPRQFAQYVMEIRSAERLCGTPGKHVLDEERDVRRVSRQSLVVARDVSAGDIIREEDLTVQRPGTGIPAAMIDRIVGRRAAHPLRAGTMLAWAMLHQAA